MTVAEYINHRYRHNNYRYWWGLAHRARLIDTDQYIKTSEQPRLRIRWADPTPRTACAVRESWGEFMRLVQENS